MLASGPTGRCRLGVLAALLMAMTGAPAHAQADATVQATRIAYEASIKCFQANGLARSDAVQLGKKASAAAISVKAKASFDAAVKLGAVLGYSGPKIQQDIDDARARELPKLVHDPAYFRTVSATCKALELM